MTLTPQIRELLLQALEHERGGVLVYQTALECVAHDELREEWEKYLMQTATHVDALTQACMELGLDPDETTPGRAIVRHTGASLVVAMKMALAAEDREAAELVACDAVVLAETRDHANWHLIGECAKHLEGPAQAALQRAYEQVEDEEDEHLYHSKGWCRELWLNALGLEAQLPPPEEERDVKSAAQAAQVEAERSAQG
jgi:hypothetical protein